MPERKNEYLNIVGSPNIEKKEKNAETPCVEQLYIMNFDKLI